MAIGTVVLLSSLFGMLCNGTALHYFYKHGKTNVFSKIFFVGCSTDMLTSFLTVFVAVSYLLLRQPGAFSDTTFNEIWGSLWNFVSRYSVYVVAVMSITRTARILFPFRAIRSNVVLASLAIFAMWLLSTTPFFYGINHYYKKEWCALALNKSEFVEKDSHDIKYYLIVLSIPVLLLVNIPLVFISASLSFYKIYKSMMVRKIKMGIQLRTTTEGRRQTQRKLDKKDSSVQSGITILCVVLIYLLFNIPYAVVYLHVQTVSSKRSISPANVFNSKMIKKYVIGMTHVLSISLNAVLNPVVLFLRMNNFKDHVNSLIIWGLFRRGKSRPRDRYKERRGYLNKVILNKSAISKFEDTVTKNSEDK